MAGYEDFEARYYHCKSKKTVRLEGLSMRFKCGSAAYGSSRPEIIHTGDHMWPASSDLASMVVKWSDEDAD